MTPSKKGNYTQCLFCKFKLNDENLKYPCTFSHRVIRKSGNVKYERDFRICGKFEMK